LQGPNVDHRWDAGCSVSVPDAPQIIEPQKPRSSSTRPNAQQAAIAWNVFKEEFIKRQQQSDIQRRLAFVGIAAPTTTHIATPTTSGGPT
jgi:hypothetical protein